MAKVKQRFAVVLVLTLWCCCAAAQPYTIRYYTNHNDSLQLPRLALSSSFPSRLEAGNYVSGLLPTLQGKGFVAASIDSLRLDSATASVALFLGEPYQWAQVRTAEKDAPVLEAIHFPALRGNMDFTALNSWQKRILDYLEENGHPFGRTFLDSIEIGEEGVAALLKIDPGPLYKIDSIQVIGDAKVNAEFLQKYLQLPNGSLYSKSRLVAVKESCRALAASAAI